MIGAVLLVSGTPLPTLGVAYTIVFGAGAIAAWSSPYRRARLFTFLDPWKDPLGAGLQNVQAQISLGSGGIFGRGLGQGIEKIHYLPEAHTDMIFAVIGEELGLRRRRGPRRRLLRLRVCGPAPRDRAARTRSGSASPRASPPSSAGRRRSTSPPFWGSLR